jgi:hypothetical protein
MPHIAVMDEGEVGEMSRIGRVQVMKIFMLILLEIGCMWCFMQIFE